MVVITTPWSKKHKKLTKFGSLPYNLSNSFAETVSCQQLIDYCYERGDIALIEEYQKSHSLEYTPNGGSLDLREEIAKFYGPKITADNILVFPGAQVAVQTAAFAVLGRTEDDDDTSWTQPHAIVFTPGYQSLVEGPRHAGSEVTQIQLQASKGWQIDVEEVKQAIQPNTRYLVLNQPYNPAGTLIPASTQEALVAVARQHTIVVLCDEVYRLLEHDDDSRIPAMCDAYERGLSIVTQSKPWGACGVTIGWIATQDLELKERLWNVQYFGCACPSRASELQGIMVLRASDQILQRNLQIIRSNMKLLDAFLEQYKEFFSWVRPTAGAVAAVYFKGPWTTEELGQHLAEAGIGVKPAYCFSGENVVDEVDYFRIGYGESSMPTALRKLKEFADRHKDKWRSQMSS
ncbi:AspC4 family aminotransferase [Nitzschia inconspicua]|uniref:AspC4 family aminotransferase n=1 Tax=Nitzschia inconspicua TaxID=303405 RepID=A0A9K3PCD4_9STRA|nr:AspC4 family aminotransferase [Nitzschia inconspicua]